MSFDAYRPKREPMTQAAEARLDRILNVVPVSAAEQKRIAKAAGEAMNKIALKRMMGGSLSSAISV